VDTQFKSASIYAQIAADRVDNIIFENVNIYGSLNGRGTYECVSPGTFRRVNRTDCRVG